MASIRPIVSVYAVDGSRSESSVKTPMVFSAPLRSDIVSFVAAQMQLNSRQAYAVSKNAGYQTAAESWGTGRAVARIPRVPGGGTHRAGQGAFGNMCRGGGMFAPTKVWRKWHHRINVKVKRHAVAAGVASSSLPALVSARGHRIDDVAEFPIVVSDDAESFVKTNQAVTMLKKLGLAEELDAVIKSKKVTVGKGKYRNRRYSMKKGPLFVYKNDEGCVKAFRNIPGVETCNVSRLHLRQLCPGGHLGRLVVYTQAAFSELKAIYGTGRTAAPQKKNFWIGKSVMTNCDVHRIINSDEIQSVLNARKEGAKRFVQHKNPLKNIHAMDKLNPGAFQRRAMNKVLQDKNSTEYKTLIAKRSKRIAAKKASKPKGRAFFKALKAAYAVKEQAAPVEVEEEE